MYITLWERNFDLVAPQSFVNCAIQLVRHSTPISRIGYPAQQFKIQGEVAESTKSNAGLRIREYFRVFDSYPEKDLNNLINIAAVGNTHSHANAML